jgi:hypothetical protein
MTQSQPGHGLDDYLRKLNAIPAEVKVTANVSSDSSSDADFDRRVRQSLDRQHRRQVIAGS